MLNFSKSMWFRRSHLIELQDAINQRHSIRQFTDKPVEKKMITKIVELAQRAPSWVNSQPWQVYCAMGDTLQEIKNAYRDQDIAGNQGDSDESEAKRS